jgi:glycosyltransferase involved in cell wall biosynthesis
MRICTLAMTLPVHATGGMEIHTLDLARGLAEAGHDVTIVTGRHPGGVERESVGGVDVHYADSEPTSRRPLSAAAIDKMRQLHSEKAFDVVHSQSAAGLLYLTGGYKRSMGVPFVATLHGTNFGEIRSNLNQGFTPMLLPKVAYQLWCHQFRSRPLVAGSDAVIAVSRELRDSIRREYNIDSWRIHTVYNGIDTEAFKPIKIGRDLGLGRKRVVLSASVLHRQKGVQYLVEAFAAVARDVPDAHLVIVGDGPFRSGLESQVSRLSLSGRVSFAGRRPNSELRDYYNLADVFVIPTVRVEGLPLIELEAMACGRPVVASDIGGIPTVIEDGVNGLLVAPKDVAGLAEKMKAVLSDAAFAQRLGSAARATIVERFSRERMVADTVAVYRSVVR